MIRSMTGYGKYQQLLDQCKLSIEVKSLNSKQLDLAIRIPTELKHLEIDLRNRIADSIQRGKVDITIAFEDQKNGKTVRIDMQTAQAAYDQIEELSKRLGIEMPDNVVDIISKSPGFFAAAEPEPDPAMRQIVLEAVDKAIREFDAFRIKEGKVLMNDIIQRIEKILQLLDETASHEQSRHDTIKARLIKSINEFIEHQKFDPNRFEQELIYYLEKLDISEEKLRLRQHCNYFNETINDDNAGKKLGFITQEIGREINTLGSKANDAQIQRIVVQMKDELEKIKEQLFNIL
jgi:uncharacterized protein (TIGR00255 family)